MYVHISIEHKNCLQQSIEYKYKLDTSKYSCSLLLYFPQFFTLPITSFVLETGQNRSVNIVTVSPWKHKATCMHLVGKCYTLHSMLHFW